MQNAENDLPSARKFDAGGRGRICSVIEDDLEDYDVSTNCPQNHTGLAKSSSLVASRLDNKDKQTAECSIEAKVPETLSTQSSSLVSF